MNTWRWVDPRVQQLGLADVQSYLVRQGWALQPSSKPHLLRFVLPGTSGAPPLFQMVPASEQAADYRQRITEFLTTLSEIEGRHPVAVLEDILAGSEGIAADGKESGRDVGAERHMR